MERPVYRADVASHGAPAASACDNCGAVGGALEPVRRVYLDLDPGDADIFLARLVMPEIERWCPACRASYPHQPA